MKQLIRGSIISSIFSLLAVSALVGVEEVELLPQEDVSSLEEGDEFEALMDEMLPDWQWSGYVRSAIGYTDNALLSSVNPRSDNYLRTEFDFFLWKLPSAYGDGYIYINGVDIRFDDLEGADKEQVWLGDLRWNQYVGDSSTVYVELLYMYQDQVIDFSESLFYSFREQVRSHRYGPSLGWIQGIGERHELELSGSVYREEYQELLDNQWKPGLELEWRTVLGKNWELGSRLSWDRRVHDDRLAKDDGGHVIAGQGEEVDQTKGVLFFKHPVWKGLDASMRWEMGRTWQRDNGGGFLDFDQTQAKFYLDGRWRGWELLVEAGWSETSYHEQRLSLWDATLREKRDRYVNAEISHQITSRGRIFSACEFNKSSGRLGSDNFSDVRMHVGFQIYLERIFSKDE